MNRKIKWGIIGLGHIAKKFAADLMLSDDAILYGVAARDSSLLPGGQTRAKIFAKTYQAEKHFDSYASLAADPNVDIVYIATPHTFHFEHTMMCLEQGRAVLCEKPMGINAEQVQLMKEQAQKKEIFLMEAIWTRFIPAIEKYMELLQENVIGDVLNLEADFGFKANTDPNKRLFNKALGGGSLMDVGIYPVYLSLLTLGVPSIINATAQMTTTEVDAQCQMIFNYKNSVSAHLASSIESDTPTEALIKGTKGSIKLHTRFHHPRKITLEIGDVKEEINLDYRGNGYIHEIEEVHRCLWNNETESHKLTLQTSLELSQILDGVKDAIGLEYEL